MVSTKTINTRPGQSNETVHFAVALGIGLLLEVGGLALLLPAMAHRESPTTTPAPIRISIVAPAPAPPPPAPKPVPIPPKPVTPPTPPPLPVAPPIPMPPPPPKPAAHHVTRHYAPRRVLQAPPPVLRAVPKPVPPTPHALQPPLPPAPTGGQVDLFSAAIKRALQAHANEVYPPAAQMAHQAGSPELTFSYLNGVVTNIALTRSCGFPLLDQAALQDARIASYPPPPQGFTGRSYQVTVTVTFVLAAISVDGD